MLWAIGLRSSEVTRSKGQTADLVITPTIRILDYLFLKNTKNKHEFPKGEKNNDKKNKVRQNNVPAWT